MGKCIKYSIIVPIYNVELFLKDCLDSIKNSMTDDCECILVNDGSTDSSGMIAEKYCASNERFHYYAKDNGGLSDARNFGLHFATGVYVLFVDSDDIVSPVLIKAVDQALKNNNADVVYYNYLKFYSESVIDLFTKKGREFHIRYSGKEELSQKPNFAWARVAKRSVYFENHFPVGVIYEDVYTSPYITQNANVVGFIDTPLYGYRKRAGSITTTSAEKQFQLFETVKLLKNRQESKELDFKFYSTALVNLSQSCLVSLVRIEDTTTRSFYRKKIKDEYRNLSCSQILNSYSKLKFKCLSLVSKSTIGLYLLEKILRPVVLFSDKRNH
ncbi:TPA: glycosyltransferase family 2 protein [Citrobacter koseri]